MADAENSLYEAAKESIVSEDLDNSTFRKIAKAGHETVGDLDEFKSALKRTEKIVKKEFELASMPGPWRSAKSVVLSAMKLGIPLMNDNDELKGKTALQIAIREAKHLEPDQLDLDTYCARILRMISYPPPHLPREAVAKLIKTRI